MLWFQIHRKIQYVTLGHNALSGFQRIIWLGTCTFVMLTNPLLWAVCFGQKIRTSFFFYCCSFFLWLISLEVRDEQVVYVVWVLKSYSYFFMKSVILSFLFLSCIFIFFFCTEKVLFALTPLIISPDKLVLTLTWICS